MVGVGPVVGTGAIGVRPKNGSEGGGFGGSVQGIGTAVGVGVGDDG